MDETDYRLTMWLEPHPGDGSAWAELGHYATLTEAREAAAATTVPGLRLRITHADRVLLLYHDYEEVRVREPR